MGQLLPHAFVATSTQGCILPELRNQESLVAKKSLLFLRKNCVHVVHPVYLLTPTSLIVFASRQE